MLSEKQTELAHHALDGFAIELPSWGFANTGTRFGKFVQASAATNTEEKLADAGVVHRLTGCCPNVAVHVLWDFPNGLAGVPALFRSAAVQRVDNEKLAFHQNRGDLVDAEECLRAAFFTDVRPAIQERRKARGLAEDPLAAFRESGYLQSVERERGDKNRGAISSYA
jgi:L-rhamnose isomerase